MASGQSGETGARVRMAGVGAAGAAGVRGCCCGGCCGCGCPKDFQKVLELKDLGLVIYRHTARTEERNKVSGVLESATDTTEDVFILLNTKSTEMTSAQYLPGIETTKINCPRCRQLAEQVHKMLQRAPNIERKPAFGICDRCLMRGDSCYNCQRILDKFLSKRREVSDGTKTLIRQWLSKIQHIIEDITGLEERRYGAGGAGAGGRSRGAGAGGATLHSERIRASSELYIDQIFMRSRKDTRQLDIKPLFRPRVIRLDERGQFVEDRSRFQGSDVSRMFDLSGETRTRRDEREHEHDGREWHRQHDALPDDLWTRRSHSQESFREAARRDSDRFQEGGYKRAGDRRYFNESDDIKSHRLRDRGEVSESYARGDAHYKQLSSVRSRSLAPTRKGTRVDTSADTDLAQGDDRSLFDLDRGKGRGRTPVQFTSGKGERAERKRDERYMEHDTKDRSKKDKEEQKLRDKYETGRTKTHKGEISQQDQHKLKSDKDKSAKDKIELEQKRKGEREYSTKGGQEQKQKGEKEYGTKDKGGQEPKKKGEKELGTKDKGGQEPKQKGEKEYSGKDKVGQEPKKKGEKEFGTKDKSGQGLKQKGEKEYGTKDKGGQEQKQKGEKEVSTKEKTTQVPTLKGEKESSSKDKSGQEPKQKGEKELSTKDKGGEEQKQKGDKGLSTKDKGGEEQKQKGDKGLSTKDKGGEEQKQKGEKELSTKDKGGEEQKQKGEKGLSTKDKGGEEHKQKGEKELSTKDKGGEEQKQKGEKKLSTKDKGGEEQKQKEKSDQELQQKGKTEKDKGVSDIKQKEKVGKESNITDKEAPERNKKSKGEKEGEITKGAKSKGTGDKDMGETGKGGKESDSETKGGTDTKIKGKGEKESDKKSKHTEIGSKDKEKQKKPSALTILMEQKKKEPKFKDYTGPKGRKDEDEADDLLPKDRKTGKKREENKKGEDKKDKQVKKKASIVEEKEIAVNKIRVRRPSPDDTILKMVKLKLAEIPARALNEVGMKVNLEQILIDHFQMKHASDDIHLCPFCNDSDYGEDTLVQPKEADFDEVIIGAKVFKYKPPLLPHIEDPHEQQENKKNTVVPLQFKSTYEIENIVQIVTPPKEEVPPSPPPVEEKKGAKKPGKQSKAQETEPLSTKGITHFQLSDRSFIEKGWTMLPTEKIVRKMNVYRMRPAQPEFNWFEHNRRKRLMKYESGERLAEFDDAGHGRWYYRNGRLALDYYDAEGLNAQQRFVIYSSGEPDERGRAHPYTILATFDYLGNGIVFDHTGKIRLKYNQTEGIVLDRNIGPVSHWKWHSLNDPPVLAQVMIDTQEPDLDPRLVELGARAGGEADGVGAARPQQPDNDDMLAIEFDNFVRAKSEKLTQAFKPFQIKMKALKINEYFSLRVLDQATVYLIYRDGTTNLKLNLGMVLDHHEIVDTDMADMGEVPSELERYPARTESIAALQRGVRSAQRWERARQARDRRLHPTLPLPPASADRLAAAATAPHPYGAPATASPAPCRCSRRPTGPSLYYDNRIF